MESDGGNRANIFNPNGKQYNSANSKTVSCKCVNICASLFTPINGLFSKQALTLSFSSHIAGYKYFVHWVFEFCIED